MKRDESVAYLTSFLVTRYSVLSHLVLINLPERPYMLSSWPGWSSARIGWCPVTPYKPIRKMTNLCFTFWTKCCWLSVHETYLHVWYTCQIYLPHSLPQPTNDGLPSAWISARTLLLKRTLLCSCTQRTTLLHVWYLQMEGKPTKTNTTCLS